MKKLWLLILCSVFPVCIIAQQHTEYNRRGDEAMKNRDYSDARLFYSEGVSNCDMYSIHQLTKIWLNNERMRNTMHNVMSRCLSCLNVRAEENDTTAISKVILYYSRGIGTPQSDEMAQIWLKRLDDIRKPVISNGIEPTQRMEFFVGYSFSPLAPVGITFGGVGKRFGWYTRFKTNASFQSFGDEFSGTTGPTETTDYLYPVKKKANSLAITAGLIIKCTSWLYASVGVGYGKRDLLYLYSKRDDTGTDELGQVWYKNADASYNGVSPEIDCMVRLGSFYFNIGCNTLNFEYVDLNAGVGVFF